MPDRPTALNQVHILLIQARNTADMERQEQRCFIERTGLRPAQFTSVNVVRQPLREQVLDDVHCIMVGGAGEYSAMDDPAWMPGLLRLLHQAAEREIPVFGSCWGHQVIARAFGGTVIHDKDRAELGCGKVHLTEAGQKDPLFAPFPTRFNANMGHHDRVTELPPGAIELARNEQPNQAFRLPDVAVYGTQFHSELDAESERERLIAYRDYYREDMPDEERFQAVLDALAETTEVDHLLRDFLHVHVIDEADVRT